MVSFTHGRIDYSFPINSVLKMKGEKVHKKVLFSGPQVCSSINVLSRTTLMHSNITRQTGFTLNNEELSPNNLRRISAQARKLNKMPSKRFGSVGGSNIMYD